MRLITFELYTPLGPARRLGLWRTPRVLDVNLAHCGWLARTAEPAFARRLAAVLPPPDLLGWLEAGDRGREALEELAAAWQAEGELSGSAGERAVWNETEVRSISV
jgi:hypothetical protein